jgi:hypothetical protein
VARIVFLDAAPLGLACLPAGVKSADLCRLRIAILKANGARVVVPEIVDYEVRRKLSHRRLADGIKRLDELGTDLVYAKITTPVMRLAAILWGEVRRAGLPTSDSLKSIDADCILAAQARDACGLHDALTIATDNIRHLSRYRVDAQTLESIVELWTEDGQTR